MSGFLLDTNVLSEIVRPKPDPGVVQWVEATDESLLYISVLTLGEIRKCVTLLPPGRRRSSLESWLDHDLLLRFDGRILPIDAVVADRWGQFSGSIAAKRSPLPVIDGLLAATALHHCLTLVTRDSRHPALASVDVFNPWRR